MSTNWIFLQLILLQLISLSRNYQSVKYLFILTYNFLILWLNVLINFWGHFPDPIYYFSFSIATLISQIYISYLSDLWSEISNPVSEIFCLICVSTCSVTWKKLPLLPIPSQLKGVNLKMSQLDWRQWPISLKGAGIQKSWPP